MNNNIRDISKFLWKKKLYILLTTIIFVVIAIFMNLKSINYVATQKILLSSFSVENNLTDTYENLISSSTVIEQVIQNLGLDESVSEIANSIEIKKISNTNLLEVRVFGRNQEKLQSISNEISNVFINTVAQLYGESEIYIVDQTCQAYTKINTIIFGILAAFFGFILSSLYFSIYHIFDTKLKNIEQIESITGLRSIISIPNAKLMVKKDFSINDILEDRSDVFKILMTNIQFLIANNTKSKSILITSPVSKDGKTYIANHLAVEFAKVGKKVILIDSDMRHGKLAKIYHLPDELGFSNYLSSLDSNGNFIKERITRFIKDTEVKNLSVITSGNIPPNPTELLKPEKLNELIKELKIFYDIIIFDGVSILEGAETTVLSKVCDLSLMMPSYKKTKKIDLYKAYDEINRKDGKVIGIGFNRVPNVIISNRNINFKKSILKYLNKFINFVKFTGWKLKKVFVKIINLFIVIIKGFSNLIRSIRKFNTFLKKKILSFHKKIKEFIRKKTEKILLLEAGEEPIDENKNNIVKEIYENEIKENNEIDEKNRENEYQKKLEEMKTTIDEKAVIISQKPRPSIRKSNKKEKNNKEKKELSNNVEILNEIPKASISVETEINTISEKEDLINKQKLEREQKEEEKRKKQEEILQRPRYTRLDDFIENSPILNPEALTEEMIKKQVELDDIIRMSEMSQEIIEDSNELKEQEKLRKKQERLEKKEKLKQEKIEKRLRRENEKNKNREKHAKIREEKKAFRESEKQKQIQEEKIREDIEEDNLYPRIRI